MAINLSISSNLAELASRYAAAGLEIPLAVQMATGRAALEAKGILVDAITEHTPRSDGPGPHLADTTEGDVEVNGTTAAIAVRQTKTIQIRGTDVPLSTVLTTGHAAFDIVPATKQALWWQGAEHPTKHVHIPAQAPNTYIAQSVAAAQPALVAAFAESGQAMTLAVLNLMR